MSIANGITRRDAIKLGLAGSAACLLTGGLELFAEEAPKVDVWVIHGSDKGKLMKKALEIIQGAGGFGNSVKKLALKVNAAWARTPEQGANTHPELVGGFLSGCREFGISDVSIPELPCNAAKESFTKSGIYDAVTNAGFKMTDMNNAKGTGKRFVPVELPKAKCLTNAQVVEDFLTADAIVNMPVCKSHGSGAGGVSLAMKNWMGSIRDRGFWHKNDLQQCIADFGTLVRPTWTIIDATRVMLTKGPQGPSEKTILPDLLILSKDQLAADAYAVNEFWKNNKSAKAKYLGYAEEMGLGVATLDRINVRKIELENS